MKGTFLNNSQETIFCVFIQTKSKKKLFEKEINSRERLCELEIGCLVQLNSH